MTIANIVASRARLERYNNLTSPYGWGTGAIGRLERAAGIGYSSETFLKFDTSSIPVGSTINSCTLNVTVGAGADPTGAKLSRLFENNRSDPVGWEPNAPTYDSFTYTEWINDSTVKTSQNVEFPGAYVYPSTADFIAMVDRWVQGTTPFEWGCILEGMYDFFDWYHTIDAVTLVVDYDEPAGDEIRIRSIRGLRRGMRRGM
jgi:hypothetical protein